MPIRLRNAKLRKEDIKHVRLLVVFRKALTGETLLDLACSQGAAEITLESVLQNDSAKKCLEHPTLRATFLANNAAADMRAKLWNMAPDEFTEGRETTRCITICVVYTARTIRVVPFVSLGERRPSVPLRDFAFDVQASTPGSEKILLREIANEWLSQIRRGDRSEMAHLFGLLLEELVATNAAARKRNVIYDLDFESCATGPVEQHITVIFDQEGRAPSCRLKDDLRVYDEPSLRVMHDVLRKLRRHFQ